MKRILLILFACILIPICNAQSDVSFLLMTENSETLIGSSETVLMGKIGDFTANAICQNDNCNSRFVIALKPIVNSREIIPSTPQRIKTEINLLIRIGDVVTGKVFESAAITLKGIGLSEEKAQISCFNMLDSYRDLITIMISNAQSQAESYYCSHCDEIINRCHSYAGRDEYEQAIYELISIPNVCKPCYERCQQEAVDVYKQHIDKVGQDLYARARAIWMEEQSVNAATRIASIMAQIDPHASIYPRVEELQNVITKKLNADEKREWELNLKKYEDSQKFKMNLVDAIRDIGVAWGNNQPQSVSRTIIRTWF